MANSLRCIPIQLAAHIYRHGEKDSIRLFAPHDAQVCDRTISGG